MINVYDAGQLDPSEYAGVISNLINSDGGLVNIFGMSKSDFEVLKTTFSSELQSGVIKDMTYIPINGGEFQVIV